MNPMNSGVYRAIIGTAVAAVSLFAIASMCMDAAINSMVKDCVQLGGFRHEDKVYYCTRIRPNPVRPSAGTLSLSPDVDDSGEGSEEGEQR